MIETPVLIVGGGPVGMNLALNLAYWETPCLLVNEGADTPDHPQGNSHNARTMEHYRRLGIAEKIRTVGLPPDHSGDAIFVTRIATHEMGRINLPTNRDRISPDFPEKKLTPEPTQRASQMFVEALLKKEAETQQEIDLRFGWRMTGYTRHDDHVIAEIEETGGGSRETVRCRYLVGCDGGQSMVRRSLDIRYEGKSGLEVDFMMGQMLSTYFYAPALYDIMKTDAPWQFHTVNPDGRTSIVGLDGNGHFLAWAKVPAGTDGESLDPKPIIYAAVGQELPVDIISSKPWTAGLSLVAESYGEGRVLMAGDAVHLFTPTGGFGMNTGVDDTANLAWKLAACHQGWGGPHLTTSYEAERRPIAVRNLAQSYALAEIKSAIGVPEGIEDDGPEGEIIRQELGRRFMNDLAEEYKCIGIQLGAQYTGSAIIESDGTEPPADDPYVFTPSACPGCRAPHAWRDDGSALFDHFGKGFTLLCFAQVDVEAFASSARDRDLPITILEIKDPAIAALYQSKLALIRPDQYVAWRGNEVPDDVDKLLGLVSGY